MGPVVVSGGWRVVVSLWSFSPTRGRSELPLLHPAPGNPCQNLADGVNRMVPNYDEPS